MVSNPKDILAIGKRLAAQAASGQIRFTLHAHQEMVEEGIAYQDVITAMMTCEIIENYPNHQRGSCCLVCGYTGTKRILHVCCTTALDVAIIITVYEPKAPKWVTPYKRNR